MLYQSLVDFKGWTFIAQILNLFLQMYLFKKFLFEPVKKIFARRRQEVDELYAEADKARLDAETARSDYESRLRSADEEARAITAQAVQSARLAGDEIVSGAKREAAAMREKAGRDIELERRKATSALKNELSDLAIELAEKVVRREIDPAQHAELIDGFIDELGDDHA